MFSDLNELLKNLVISACSGAVLYIIQRTMAYFKTTRPNHRVWGKYRKKRVDIVVTTAPEISAKEHTTLVFPAEARAAAEIYSFITEAVSADCRIKFSKTFDPAKYNDTLVVIGGPNHNMVTRNLLRATADKSQFFFDEYTAVSPSGQKYVSEIDDSVDQENNIISDVGVVLRMRNPNNRENYITLLMGSRTHGCLVAARSLAHHNTLSASKLIGDYEEFGLIATAKVNGQELGEVTIEQIWKI